MNDIARAINEKTNNDEERKSLLINALADKFGTKKDNKYAMNSLGELYSKVKTSKPHSKDWYEALNNYDEAAEVYRMVIGDDALDYYNTEIEKERMKPNANEDKLDHEIVNDKAIDAIKDNFTPPGAKGEIEKDDNIGKRFKTKLGKSYSIKKEIDPDTYGIHWEDDNSPRGEAILDRMEKNLHNDSLRTGYISELKDDIDTNDNGEIEVDEMADFQKSLDDYASKNKKGREDIPARYRK